MLNIPMRRDIARGETVRKRIITKNRKEQNRVAAKAYRQRQKEKLQNLQCKSRGIQELRPRLPPLPKESFSAARDPVRIDINESQRQSATDAILQSSAAPEHSSHGTIQHENQHEAELPSVNNALSPLVPASSSVSEGSSSSMLNLGPQNLSLTQVPLIGQGECGNINSSTSLNEPGSLDVELYDTLASSQNGFPDQDILSGPITFPNSIQEYPLQPQLPSCSQCWVSEVSNIPSTESDLLLSHPIQPLADPYANYIQLWAGSAFTAGLYIALSLNLNLEGIRSSSWSSPFYRPTTLSNDPTTLLAISHIPCAPANLQPTLPQILFPHHAYLDLIPFPVFRARAITLASTVPPMFDFWDLKNDINAGLVCWNPGNGTGGGNVQPWDVRSWKAAPWFLRKWRMLIS